MSGKNPENLKRAVFIVFSERIEENFRKFPASLKARNKSTEKQFKTLSNIFYFQENSTREKSGKQN